MKNFKDLESRYPLTREQIEHYRERGYVKLKEVLSPETIGHYGEEITRQVIRLNTMTKPMSERSTYQKAFLQVMNLWRQSEAVREFVFGKRLARLAAELMGVEGVRLYHDQALYKEPGGGITPWHADQYYWPLDTPNTCTVWIPLQATPPPMGPLAFSVGSHRFVYGRDLAIGDESEAKLQQLLKEANFGEDNAAFDLGEVSFHSGWTFHRAGPNHTQKARAVMTVIYMEEGAKLMAPVRKEQQSDWENWLPGAQVGKPARTPLNPLLVEA